MGECHRGRESFVRLWLDRRGLVAWDAPVELEARIGVGESMCGRSPPLHGLTLRLFSGRLN